MIDYEKIIDMLNTIKEICLGSDCEDCMLSKKYSSDDGDDYQCRINTTPNGWEIKDPKEIKVFK